MLVEFTCKLVTREVELPQVTQLSKYRGNVAYRNVMSREENNGTLSLAVPTRPQSNAATLWLVVT